jgi:hypothetical protein
LTICSYDATVLWLLLAPTRQGLIDPHGVTVGADGALPPVLCFQSMLCSWTRARLHDDDVWLSDRGKDDDAFNSRNPLSALETKKYKIKQRCQGRRLPRRMWAPRQPARRPWSIARAAWCSWIMFTCG